MNYVALALSTLRHVLTAGGGFATGTAGQSDEQFWGGLAVMAVGFALSYVKSWKSEPVAR